MGLTKRYSQGCVDYLREEMLDMLPSDSCRTDCEFTERLIGRAILDWQSKKIRRTEALARVSTVFVDSHCLGTFLAYYAEKQSTRPEDWQCAFGKEHTEPPLQLTPQELLDVDAYA